MTTRSILCTLVVLAVAALVSLATFAPASAADVPAGTTTDAVLVAATPAPSPAAPAPAPSLILATLITVAAVKGRSHHGETPRWTLDLDAVCGVDWSNHKGFLSAKEADKPRLKLVQLLANDNVFDNIHETLCESISGWNEHWSLPMKAIQKLVDKLNDRNRSEIMKYEERIADLIGMRVTALTAETDGEGYLLIDDGTEEDMGGWPVPAKYRWSIDIRNHKFYIY